MQKQNTQADHYTMTNRRKRRVGQPGGRLWSVYNRGPASLSVKGVRYMDNHESVYFLGPDMIMSFDNQPVVQLNELNEVMSANFSVVTYFNG